MNGRIAADAHCRPLHLHPGRPADRGRDWVDPWVTRGRGRLRVGTPKKRIEEELAAARGREQREKTRHRLADGIDGKLAGRVKLVEEIAVGAACFGLDGF